MMPWPLAWMGKVIEAAELAEIPSARWRLAALLPVRRGKSICAVPKANSVLDPRVYNSQHHVRGLQHKVQK
jgi:hypothetical protein